MDNERLNPPSSPRGSGSACFTLDLSQELASCCPVASFRCPGRGTVLDARFKSLVLSWGDFASRGTFSNV